MVENIEYKGQWFLPSSKDRITGILIYDKNEGSSLELFGNFGESLFNSTFNNEVTIIHGITSDSKQITLYRCFITKEQGSKLIQGQESGISSTIYKVNYILEGVHIDSLEEMKFQKITSEIHNLDEWIGVSGFEISKINNKDFELNVNYKLPESIAFIVNDKLEGQFNFLIDPPSSSIYSKNVSLVQRVEITISSVKRYSLEELLKYLFQFQNFLILALYNRTYPICISLYSDNFMKDYDHVKAIKKIKLYFSISNSNRIVKSKSYLDMLFGYRHIQDEFSIIIKKWYEKYELLEPAFNLLFEQFYNNERFTENTFLNLAQAAETFHARIHNHTRMPKEDFKKMKDEICELAPEKHHAWLKDQFNFGNNLNLHTRLSELVSKYSNTVLDKIIGNKEDFVNQVKWSRNYYTHYSTSGAKQALKGTALFSLTEKLKILLVCAFLVEVGFDKEKLEKLLEHNKYRFFYHLVKW